MDSISNLRREAAIAELQQLGWLRHLEWRPVVDSTNSIARQWYFTQPAETPALFVADRQTAGRGRGGNEWWSPSGCLMLTLTIPVHELPHDTALHSQLALVVGVALASTVDSLLDSLSVTAMQAQLKWPNDIYVGGRKLAGILIEALQSREQPPGFAIGIGVNTQINWYHAPTQIAERAVCLSRIAGRLIECEAVLLELVQQLQNQLSRWREQPQGWLEGWRERCLLTNRIVQVRVGGQGEIVGRCEGIDAQGRLLLRTESMMHALAACEIVSWT